MATSFPSRPVITIDAPEVNNFDVQFIYKFFVPDERVNDQGTVSDTFLRRNADNFDSGLIDKINNVPRFVKFSWSKISLDTIGVETIGNEFFSNLAATNNFIQRNQSKIHNEEDFTNFGFTGMEFQDNAIDGKLYLLTSGSVSKLTNSKNIQVSKAVNQQIEYIANQVDMNKISVLDVSKFLAGEINADDLPNQTIIDSLTDLRNSGVRFFSNEQNQELIDQSFSRLKKVKTRTRINNKFLKTSLTTTVTDTLGLFSDEMGPLLAKADSIQNQEVSNTTPETIEDSEFDIEVDPITQRASPKDTTFFPSRKHVGYIIDKYARMDDGTLIPQSPIILEKSATITTIDFKVSYGTTYVYQIRAIYLLEFQTFADDSDEIIISSILVSSAPSEKVVVECVEIVPPPVPADVDVIWDAREQAPIVMWSFPVNPQRDIKRWQVFRRKSVKEPFYLQVEYNFDDSVVSTRNFETVNINLQRNLSSPQNFYIDKGFSKDSTYIYTVCSVDAHGMSSNYGIQFEIKFNRFKNNIDKKMISNSGAPKPYPNMLLNEDTFVDTIRDSNHTKMKIYFDPEYLSVVREGSNEAPFLGTKQNNTKYKMQFINVDFQQSQLLDIIVNDLRTIKKGTFVKGTNSKIANNKGYSKLSLNNKG
jgi:hypothetical protein